MKAMVVSPVGGRVPPSRGVLHNSLGINGTRRDLEAEEVAAYLTKLRSLVPDMPRKRKLSKLEVIQRVIEYICDLQTTLEETNVHNESTVAKTASRQPLQPLLNATTTVPTTTTTSTTTTITGMVAERWPVSANELQWGPGRCKLLVLVGWRLDLHVSASWNYSSLLRGVKSRIRLVVVMFWRMDVALTMFCARPPLYRDFLKIQRAKNRDKILCLSIKGKKQNILSVSRKERPNLTSKRMRSKYRGGAWEKSEERCERRTTKRADYGRSNFFLRGKM